jgi:hypothetical protein
MAERWLWLLATCLLRYDDLIMKYEIIGKHIQQFDGLVGLSVDQYKDRSQSLTLESDGIYRIDKPVQFKVGEIIGINYDPPKVLLDFMKPLELPEVEEVTELPEIEEVAELPEVEEVETKRPRKFK